MFSGGFFYESNVMAKDPLEKFFKDTTPEQLAGDPVLRSAFTVALMASELYIPVEQSENQQNAQGGVSLRAVNVNNKPHVMLFSSEARLKAFIKGGTRFAKVTGSAVLPSLRGHHAILNPGPDGRVLTPEDIATITGQQAPAHEEPGHVHGPGCRH